MNPQSIKVHFKHPNPETDYILLNEANGIIQSSEIYGIEAGDHLVFYDKIDLRELSYQLINPKQAKGGRNQDAACLDTLPVQ